MAGRRAHRVVDVAGVLRHGADLRRRHRDLVGSGEVVDVDVACRRRAPAAPMLTATRADRDEAVVAGVVGGEHGVVDELDPGRGSRAARRSSWSSPADDRVTLRRTATTGRVAERDEGVVERVAVGLELIGGGCLGGVEGCSVRWVVPVRRSSAWAFLGCRLAGSAAVSRVSRPLGGVTSSPAAGGSDDLRWRPCATGRSAEQPRPLAARRAGAGRGPRVGQLRRDRLDHADGQST